MLYGKGDKGIYEFCKEQNIKTIFVESAHVSLSHHKYLCGVFDGIHISKENKFGVRIEDMVYVTEDGCINLTNSKKELIIL